MVMMMLMKIMILTVFTHSLECHHSDDGDDDDDDLEIDDDDDEEHLTCSYEDGC